MEQQAPAVSPYSVLTTLRGIKCRARRVYPGVLFNALTRYAEST
jgi:hypothetical protein